MIGILAHPLVIFTKRSADQPRKRDRLATIVNREHARGERRGHFAEDAQVNSQRRFLKVDVDPPKPLDEPSTQDTAFASSDSYGCEGDRIGHSIWRADRRAGGCEAR
jgi:hypothetical protein